MINYRMMSANNNCIRIRKHLNVIYNKAHSDSNSVNKHLNFLEF